jgi:hypothetical protein
VPSPARHGAHRPRRDPGDVVRFVQPLPEYIRQRYDLHAALVDAIAEGDVKALDLIAEHNARLT